MDMTPMTQPATPTVSPRQQALATVKAFLTRELTEAGYTVDERHRHDLRISGHGFVLGEVGVYDINPTFDGNIRGSVSFSAQMFGSKRGFYRVTAEGEINIQSLLNRLTREVAACTVAAAKAAESRIRDAADAVILKSLTGQSTDQFDVPVRDNAKVSVFAGKVSVKLSDLTPEQATAILALLS